MIEGVLSLLFTMLVGFVIIVGGTVLWVWMIVDCATNESSEGNDKLIWILIIVLTHLLGALLYFFLRRPQRIKELGK